MMRPTALPTVPETDPELCEELLHASLRRAGWTDNRLYWLATLLGRSLAWTNALRLAEQPYGRELHVCGVCRDSVAARKTQILAEQDPAFADVEESITAHAGPAKKRNRLPEWLAEPPVGWSVE